MIRALVIALVLLPGIAAAQDFVPSVQFALTEVEGPESEARAESPRLKISLADRSPEWLTQTAPAQAQTQLPSRDRRRRRASMVGYINDAGVQSQLRFRFDAGTGIGAPDRAEFFYAKCGCYRDLAVAAPALFDPDAPGPGPGAASDLDFQQFYVQAEFAFQERISVFGELPARWVQPKAFFDGTNPTGGPPFSDSSGLSDVRAGVKVALVASDTTYLTAQAQATFPTGDGLKGLGVEHPSFEPALLFSTGVGERTNIEGQFGFVYAIDGSNGPRATDDKFAGNVLYWGIGPSVAVYLSNSFTFAPVIELVGWRVLSGFVTDPLADFPPADDTNIVNLKLGARFEFQDRNSLYVGYGHHLTDAVWYESIFRVEYRYTF